MLGHGLAAITHPRQRAGTFQALLRAALLSLQPDLRVPFCFPLADRAQLLFGDQEGHHVFPVVGSRFSRSRFTWAWAPRTLRRTSCLDSIGAIVANLRLPG